MLDTNMGERVEPPIEALQDQAGEEVALAAATVVQTNPDLGVEGFIRMAVDVAIETGVNVPKVMNEHPEKVESKIGIEPEFSQELITRIEEVADN